MINMPKTLSELLSGDQLLAGAVQLNLAKFGELLQHSRMPFFPEYTDHGTHHQEAVLGIADYLMAGTCTKKPCPLSPLTPDDACVLTMGILAHDLAMHITEDGWSRLIDAKTPWPSIPGFAGDRHWHILWAEFLREAKHWTVDQLMEVFGSAARVTRLVDDNLSNLTTNDRLLIGEFLRRHHPRLAHEIAVFGVPSNKDEKLRIEGFDEQHSGLIDLAGLVARSHGMKLRDTFDYLNKQYQRIAFARNCHVVYLMTLLRIADHLDMYAKRAPRQMRLVRADKSVISRREQEAHEAVSGIQLSASEDSEAVYIEINPELTKSFAVYERLNAWVSGIQEELDHSWAVIGELYGHEVGLPLRRVKTNMHTDSFLSRLSFVPIKTGFSVVPHLLPLFAKPLYGYQPAVGVRELVQNAIDAVREARAFYTRTHGDWKLAQWPKLCVRSKRQDIDVLVEVCRRGKRGHSGNDVPKEWETWLEVADRGIGMTPHVINEYFLKAGATFWESPVWFKHFDGCSPEPVLRSGYFGIGLLAAFLLGNEIQVSTRSLLDPTADGVVFTATLGATMITLRRMERDCGTTVRVRLDKNTAHWLETQQDAWNWYLLDDPLVERFISTFKSPLPKRISLPLPFKKLPVAFRRLVVEGYPDIHWSLVKRGAFLSCNGIRIMEEGSPWRYLDVEDGVEADWCDMAVKALSIQQFAVSVFDDAHNLPLTLRRDDLQEKKLPFARELKLCIVKDLCGSLVATAPLSPPTDCTTLAKYRKPSYAVVCQEAWSPLGAWVALRTGVLFSGTGMMRDAGVRSLLICDHSWSEAMGESREQVERIMKKCVAALDAGNVDGLVTADLSLENMAKWLQGKFDDKLGSCLLSTFGYSIQGFRVLTRRGTLKKHVGSDKKLLECSWEQGRWATYEYGQVPSDDAHLRDIASVPMPWSVTPFIVQVHLLPHGLWKMSKCWVHQMWVNLVGKTVLPYSLQERLSLSEESPGKLVEYLRTWLTIAGVS